MTLLGSDTQLPTIGTRFNYASNLGTVRYVGQVDGTKGIWLGIEWDDPQRGKHNGSNDGRQYFSCIIPNSASFIRPSPSIILGHSFLDALLSKYVEIPSESPIEKVVLGSSNSTIQVEAVGMNKIRSNLARLERLRQVSLDMQNVAYADAPGEIRKKCPNIRGVDLSRNLIPTWEVLARITTELPELETLSLNYNRLSLPSQPQSLQDSFIHVRDLRLNGTLMTWQEVLFLLPCFPELSWLEIGLNHLRRLEVLASSQASTKLTTLNFEQNQLDDWQNVMDSIATFAQLDRIILSDNMFKSIPPSPSPSVKLLQIKYVAVASNSIRSWSDIDALHAWFPELEKLNISLNPIVQDPASRPLIIARLSNLVTLNASAVSSAERRDSELFYLSSIVKNGPRSEESRELDYPRYRELCDKYGKPDERREIRADTLRIRLIQPHFFRLSNPNSLTQLDPSSAPEFTLRILPSMTLRALCLKVSKTLAAPHTSIRLWLILEREDLREFAELDTELGNRPVEWWGIENKSKIAFCV